MRGLSIAGGGFMIGGLGGLSSRGVPSPTLNIDFVQSPVIPPGWRYSRASTATYFGADGLMHNAVADQPRFDYEPVARAPLGLLIENVRVNFLLNADAAEKWIAYGAAVTIDGTLSQDGKTSARRVTEDTSNGPHAVSQVYATSTSGSTWTYWCRLKPDTRTIAMLMLTDGATQDYAYAVFDLSVPRVISTSATKGAWTELDAAAIPLPNGWTECGVTGSVSSAVSIRVTTYLCKSNGTYLYTGDGASALYQASAQLEASGFDTSYLPTTSATVVRAADLTKTTDLSWLNPTDGTFVLDAAFEGVLGGGMFACSLDDGVNNGLGVYKVNGSGGLGVYSGGAGGTSLGTVKNRERFRAGLAWTGKGASATASLDGAKPITVAQSAAVNPVALSLGSARTGNFASSVWVRSFQYWPRRLSDAELASVTTIPTITASNEFFGVGDGMTTQFQLTYQGQPVHSVTAAAIFRSDWQGRQTLYKTPRTNRVTHSNDFSAASWLEYWVKPADLANNALGPDGVANSAWSFSLASATGGPTGTKCGVVMLIPTPVGTVQTASLWAYADQPVVVSFGTEDGATDLRTLASTWRRMSRTATSLGTGRALQFYVDAQSNSGVPMTSRIYLAFAQSELSATATSYIATDDAAVEVTDYALALTGMVTFSSPPPSGARLTWSGEGVARS